MSLMGNKNKQQTKLRLYFYSIYEKQKYKYVRNLYEDLTKFLQHDDIEKVNYE